MLETVANLDNPGLFDFRPLWLSFLSASRPETMLCVGDLGRGFGQMKRCAGDMPD